MGKTRGPVSSAHQPEGVGSERRSCLSGVLCVKRLKTLFHPDVVNVQELVLGGCGEQELGVLVLGKAVMRPRLLAYTLRAFSWLKW